MKKAQNRKIIIAGAAGIALLAAAFLIPIRLSAELIEPVYAYEPVKEQTVKVISHSLLGRSSAVERFTITAPVPTNDSFTAQISSGLLKGSLQIDPVDFAEYKLEYDTPLYEREAVNFAGVKVLAQYADGAEHPVEAALAASDPIALESTAVTVEGPCGTRVQPLDFVKLKALKKGESNGSVLVYKDGRECKLEAPDSSVDFSAPRLLSCQIEENTLVLVAEADTDAERYYCVHYAGVSDTAEKGLDVEFGSGSITFRLPWKTQYLQEKFVISGAAPGCSPKAGNSMYISNPGAIAERDFTYPVQPSKKGLQVVSTMMDDVAELGIHHSAINIAIDQLMVSGSLPYEYNGTTYLFNPVYVSELDAQLEALGSQGITTTAVILLRYNPEALDLIYPGAAVPGHTYYALNMRDEEAKNKLAAIFTFLAERYSDEQHLLVNWILGNEVANFRDWWYCAGVGFEEYIRNYADSFRLLYNCTRSVYPYSKTLISLDNCWNFRRGFAYTGRTILDGFAREIEKHGEIDWCFAYHAHSEPLADPSFWTYGSRVTFSINSQMISMINLDILTDYVKNTYGEEHKFILSETGYPSNEGETVQAAAIAYAYYLVEQNDMVDSLILHRQVDAPSEVAVGLPFGIWTNNGNLDEPGRKKKAWEVVKYMDTDPSYTQFAPSVIGAQNWTSLVGYEPKARK